MQETSIKTARHLARVCVLAAIVSLAYGNAHADQNTATKKIYHISSGTLGSVLNQFAAEAGILLSSDGQLAQGKVSNGLEGEYTVAEAFEEILRQHGLIASHDTTGTYLIRKKNIEDHPSVETLQEVKVKATASQKAADGPVNGYLATKTNTATYTEAVVHDIPLTVTVVSKELIADQGSSRLEDVVVNVPGVQSIAPYVGASTIGFSARGFTNGRYLLDGFNTVSYLPSMELANIERVEFLRGPSGVLYGYGQPGGVANIVTKRANGEAIKDISTTFDAYGQRRLTADMGGVVLPGMLNARLNAVVEDSETFRDFADKKRIFIAPTFTWTPSDKTKVVWDVSYDKYRFQADRGFGYSNSLIRKFIAKNDATKNLSERKLPLSEIETLGTRLDIQQALSANFDLRLAAFHYVNSANLKEIGYTGLDADGRTVNRYYQVYDGGSDNRTKNTSLFAHLKGRFELGPSKHEVLFGLQHDKSESPYSNLSLVSGSNSFSSIDFYNPVYADNVPRPTELYFKGSNNFKANSFYLQDMMALGEKWKMLAGLRRDRYTSVSEYEDTSGSYPSDSENSKTTGRIGIVWQPNLQTSIYANVAETFNPNLGRSRTGAVFAPEEGLGYEVGLKYIPVPGLSFNTALFQITKDNVLTTDPVNGNFSVLSGQQQSRGIEFEMLGQLGDYSQLSASLSHLFKYEVTRDNDDTLVGNHLSGAAQDTASIWLKHNLMSLGLRGWGVGGGIFYASSRFSRLDNALRLPSYNRVDAALYYDTGEHWSFQANLRNLSNELILLTNDGGGIVAPDEPRNLRVTATYRF